jgi:septum formation topological specificity factor MinE
LQEFATVLLADPLAVHVEGDTQGSTSTSSTTITTSRNGSSRSSSSSRISTLLAGVVTQVLGAGRVPHLSELQEGYEAEGPQYLQRLRQSMANQESHAQYPAYLEWLQEELLNVMFFVLYGDKQLQVLLTAKQQRHHLQQGQQQEQQQQAQKQWPAT